jgi:parvulin-like peptidyl-prolyl isomerase
MLESMRKHMNWLMWITIILVTITFLFFGIYPSKLSGETAANVGGDVISMEDFNREYRTMYEMYRSILKDKFNEAMAKDLKTEALRKLVTDRLFIQEADRLGFSVGDQELQTAIMQEPAFLRDGVFDKKRYERTLDMNNLKPAQFESKMRGDILKRKLEQLVKDGVGVSEDELAAAYQQGNPKAKPGDFAKNRETFRQRYLQAKQREALAVYSKGIYDKTEIKINERLRS